MSFALSIIVAFVVALIPILLWAYLFSYVENETLSARRFLFWMIIGGVSVLPVAFMPEILHTLGLDGYNVFLDIANQTSALGTMLDLAGFLLLVVVIVGASSFILRWTGILEQKKISLSTFLALLWILGVFGVSIVALRSFFSESSSVTVHIASASLSGFASIALAYFVVGSVEETGKYIGFFGTFDQNRAVSKGILAAVFVALGFAFLENIMYFSSIFRSSSDTIFGTWLLRSAVAVGLHVLCAVIASVPVIRFLRNNQTTWPISTFFLGLLLSIGVHAIFDIALSYGKMGVILAYLAFGYFYLTRVFYKTDPIEIG